MKDRKNTVGVRELRQNLSVYLRRVRAGESFRVTEHGRVVAAVVPLPEDATPLEQLAREGRLTPAAGDLLALGPPPGPVSKRASRALEELRVERL